MKKTLVFSFFAFLFALQVKAQNHIKFNAGEVLQKGQKISNGIEHLIMQEDGNLVFYHYTIPFWATMTNGKAVTHATMQQDGNLVVYNGTTPVWASDTWNKGAEGGYLMCNYYTRLVAIYGASGNLVATLKYIPRGQHAGGGFMAW